MLVKSILKSFLLSFLLGLSSLSYSLDLELTQGINSALPIAINSFGTDATATELATVINNDLRLSGQFKIIGQPNGNNHLSIEACKNFGADSLVKGQVNRVGFNRFDIHFDLLDAASSGKRLLNKDFQVSSRDVRALAHHISDMIYEKLIGERGIFSTRIAYIHVQHPRDGQSRYSLEVADADGYNPQELLVSPEPIMSPSWSPDGQQIAYVSFEKQKAQIFTVSVESGKRRLITNFAGINGAPSWSNDGRQLAVVLSKSGSPKIYTVDLSTGNMRQLTFGESIDTEPRFSPDGRSLLFTSGRGGSPQVYKLDLGSGRITRLTFTGNYNARATYTPNQKNIVLFHKEEHSGFNIAVQDVDNGRLTTLTSSALDDSPSVSPNGRLVLYATRRNEQGVLGIVSVDGRIQMRLPAREGNVQEPAWSPYLG